MASPELDNQKNELKLGDLTRKPIHREKSNIKGHNSKTEENLYPPLECLKECNNSNMDEDTLSVQNGLDDHDLDDSLVSPNIDDDFMPPLRDKSNVNSKLGPKQQEIVDSLSTGEDKKPRQRRNKKNSHKPPQLQYNNQKDINKYLIKYLPKGIHLEKKTNILSYRYCLLFLVLLIVSYIAYRKFFYSSINETKVIWNYQSIISNFTDSFTGQPYFSFKIFKSALNSINEANPSAPAIILFLASKGAEAFARSLADKLVHSVSPSPIKLYGKDYAHRDTESGKKLIDDALRSMQADMDLNYGAVLVEDLQLIPGETALMFHTYCDSENAPFKHAVYALIVNTDEIIPFDSKGKDWDEAAYECLNKAWADIHEDQRDPLLSRVTVSVVAIIENNMAV